MHEYFESGNEIKDWTEKENIVIELKKNCEKKIRFEKYFLLERKTQLLIINNIPLFIFLFFLK